MFGKPNPPAPLRAREGGAGKPLPASGKGQSSESLYQQHLWIGVKNAIAKEYIWLYRHCRTLKLPHLPIFAH